MGVCHNLPEPDFCERPVQERNSRGCVLLQQRGLPGGVGDCTKDNQDSSNLNPDAVMKAASDLGAQGWELVSVSKGKLYF